MVALGTNSLDLHRFARRLRRRDNGSGRKVEWHAEDIGVFGVEKPFLVKIVGLTPQSAADDLLAKKLGAKRADAKNMSNVIGVPAFGEHRDRYHAANIRPELTGLADGIHGFAKKFLIGD